MNRHALVLSGLISAFAAIGLCRRAEALDTCAACVAAGGVWFEDDDFCMKKLEPILGPVLEPIPEEPIEFELIPGNFNGAPGMGAYPDPLAPVIIGGNEFSIHDEFVISTPGQTEIRSTSGQLLDSFVLGGNQIAFGALADWNGATDLLLLNILEVGPGSAPGLFNLTPIDSDNDQIAGQALTLPGLGDFNFKVSFVDVASVPEPSGLAVLLASSGLLAAATRRR